MTRPDYTDIANGSSSWDADVNDNYEILRRSIPFPEYVDLAALTSARPPAQNEGCAAAITTPSWSPYWCDGSSWLPWPGTIAPHAATHFAGGTDQIPHQNLQGAGTNDHAAIDAHIANTSNPHSTTAADVGADPAGTAAAAVAVHEAAGDPHPGYQLESEKGVASGYASLDAGGKVPSSQLPAFGTGLNFLGFWNANTNTPSISSGVGSDGDFYIVSVAGTTSIDGISDWAVGDWAIFYSGAWRKLDNTESVTSVNGFTGVVVLGASDVGAAGATHAANHSQGGSDPISVENLATSGAVGTVPTSDGAGGMTMLPPAVSLEDFYTEELTPAPTSGVSPGTFTTFHSDTTSALSGGDYLVWWSYEWSLNATNGDFIGRVRVDGQELINPGDTPGRSIHQQEPKDSSGTGTGGTNQVHVASGFRRLALTSGTKAVQMQFAKDNAGVGVAVTVYSFKLYLVKVS